jgi:transcriptional regulator with PAS, ATPase and Fis domain
MERAALLAEHDQVSAGALSFGAPPEPAQDIDGMTLEQAEAWLVARAVERHEGNLQRAADALGITRQSLYRRLEKHDLRPASADADQD